VNRRNELAQPLSIYFQLAMIVGMENKTFISLQELSRRLGLPVAWLRAEAKARRIPSLRTARRLMFKIAEVESAIATQSRAKVGCQILNAKDARRRVKGGRNAH